MCVLLYSRQQKLEKVMDQEGLADEEVSLNHLFSNKEPLKTHCNCLCHRAIFSLEVCVTVVDWCQNVSSPFQHPNHTKIT